MMANWSKALVVACLCLSQPALAGYVVTDIGVPFPYVGGEALHINNDGHVVGYLDTGIVVDGVGSTGTDAFVWKNGTLSILPRLTAADVPSRSNAALGINSAGTVVGGVFDPSTAGIKGAKWTFNGSGYALSILPANPIHADSNANSINDLDQIVGIARPGEPQVAILWDPVHGVVQIGNDDSTSTRSSSTAQDGCFAKHTQSMSPDS